MNRTKLLDAFIRQNLFALLSLAGASAIFLVVIVLCRLPAESVGYASLLAAFSCLSSAPSDSEAFAKNTASSKRSAIRSPAPPSRSPRRPP